MTTTARPLQYLNLGVTEAETPEPDSGSDAAVVVAPITAADLANALRLGDTPAELAEVARLLQFATAAVTKHAPAAPGVVAREAIVRTAGYLADMPNAARGAGYADVLRNSGALAIMAPYRTHRAGTTGAPAAATAPDPVAGLRETGVEVVVVAAARQWVLTALPFPSGEVFGIRVDDDPIALALTADLPDPGVAPGGDASMAIGMNLYALDAAAMGGALFFAASGAGTFTVRVFEYA